MKATVMKKPLGGIRTTDPQIDEAISTARARKSTAVRIVKASFDPERDAITAALSNGSEISVPRSAIAGLDRLQGREIVDIAPQSSGFSVWSESADVGVRVETLLEAVAGPTIVPIAARIIGSQTSPRKAAAARANGQKGGRPLQKRKRAKTQAAAKKA